MDVEVEDVADKELFDVGPNLVMPSPRMEQDSRRKSFNDDDDLFVSVAQHPLCLPVVSSLLFDYMDVAALKTARLVCTAWAEAGASKLIKKATLLVHGGKNLNSFATILGQTSKNRFQKYKFANVRVAQFNRIFNSTGQHIKAFSLGKHYRICDDWHFNVEFLRSILLECPYLEDLDLFCPGDDFWEPRAKLWESGKTFKLKKATIRAESGIDSDLLTELINVCPDLRSFNIASGAKTIPNGSQVLNLGASGKVNLVKLDELNFGSNSHLNNQTVRLFRAQKLNLSKLGIGLSEDVDGASMEEMLQHLSGTLTSFDCDIGGEGIGFPLVLPVNMTRLATVVITTDNNFFFMDPIVSASKLPNLNTLLLYGVNYYNKNQLAAEMNPDGFGDCWRRQQLELDVTNCCPSLKTLQIPGGLTCEQVLGDIAAVFPNVTDLRLANPSFNVIAAVFANYSNLERLSIKVDKYRTTCHNNPAQDTQIWAGLKDMKNLKYFELRQQKVSSYRTTEPTSSNRVATKVGDSHLPEGTLLHGLQYLTKAIQIDLQGCQQFSKEAIEELKFALGTCYLNIT